MRGKGQKKRCERESGRSEGSGEGRESKRVRRTGAPGGVEREEDIGRVEENRGPEGRELVVQRDDDGDKRVKEVEKEDHKLSSGGPKHQKTRLGKKDVP